MLLALAFAIRANIPVPLVGTRWRDARPGAVAVGGTPRVEESREPESPGAPKDDFLRIHLRWLLGILTAPGYRVFVDDRCELFGDGWLVDFVNAENTGTAEAMARWEAQFGRFDFALTANPSGYGDYFEQRPGEWELVTKTDRVRFFVRRP